MIGVFVSQVEEIGVCQCGDVVMRRSQLDGGYSVYCLGCGGSYKIIQKVVVVCSMCRKCYKGDDKYLNKDIKFLLADTVKIKFAGFCSKCLK